MIFRGQRGLWATPGNSRYLRVTPANCDEWGTEVPKGRFIEKNGEGDWESRFFQGRQESHRRQKCLKARWRIHTQESTHESGNTHIHQDIHSQGEAHFVSHNSCPKRLVPANLPYCFGQELCDAKLAESDHTHMENNACKTHTVEQITKLSC